MNQTYLRSDLMQTCKLLQQRFTSALHNAELQEKKFHQQRISFQQASKHTLNQAIKNFPANNPLSNQMMEVSKVLQQTEEAWTKKIAQQDAGVRFRAGFNDSLLVFVYGKVKSGKSSLGNYIAWGHTDPTQQIKQQVEQELQPVYFSGKKTNVKSGDTDKQAETNREFRVGATEATSSIQGFSLPGLTWVDSPGLHSINQENGDLARDYVEHADLILYTMKSDSPGRASDLQEIIELCKANKRVLLLITGSDDIDCDVDEDTGEIINQVIMKDLPRRKQQQEYVLNELKKLSGLNLDNIKIISLSARYAQEHAHQQTEFFDSGMGELFAELNHIAQNEGMRLKQKVPLNNFAQYLKGFSVDIQDYLTLLDTLQKPIQKLSADIPNQINMQQFHLQQDIRNEVNTLFDRLQNFIDDEDTLNQNLKKGMKTLEKNYVQKLEKAQITVLKTLISDLNQNMLATLKNDAAFQNSEFKIDYQSREVTTGVTEGTKTKYGAVGSAAGTALGAAIGGPIGAAIGGIFGGWLGSKLGDDAEVHRKKEQYAVGNNLMQMKNELIQNLEQSTKTYMNDFKKQTLDQVITQAEQLTSQLKQEAHGFKKAVNQLEHTVNTQIKA